MVWYGTVRYGQVQPHQLEQGTPGLAQWLVNNRPQDQCCFDGEIRVARLTTQCSSGRRPPGGDRLDRQRAALPQFSLVSLSVRHFIATLRDPVATGGIVFVRHG